MFSYQHMRYRAWVLSVLVFTYVLIAVGTHQAAAYELLVATRDPSGATLQLHDSVSGDLIRVVAEGIRVSANMTYGPDGDIYVADAYRPIYRLDGNSLDLLGQFAMSSRLYNYGMAFGPDGNLYVSGIDHDRIQRFDGTTGQIIDDFVTGINYPQGMTFGPVGNIYVGSGRDNSVIKYNGQTGSLINTFATGGGLDDPRGIVFGPDGNLYVSSWGTGEVLRYDGASGQFIDSFATVPHQTGSYGPTDLQFGPDGDLYVSSQDVRHYDGQTGDLLGVAVADVVKPTAILFIPEPASLALLTVGGVALMRRRIGMDC